MDHTLEVRWFVPGAPPASVVDWITALGAEANATRTDLYLVSSDPAMNVKLREEKIQTKHRLAEPVPITFAEGVKGVKERWVKWSFPTKETHGLFNEDPTGLWHPVHKERIQLEIDPDEQVALLDGAHEPTPADAAIELTVVQSRAHEAWTICMEAEGEPDALSDTLNEMGQYLFAQGNPPDLARDQSFGYARWLAGLAETPVSRDR